MSLSFLRRSSFSLCIYMHIRINTIELVLLHLLIFLSYRYGTYLRVVLSWGLYLHLNKKKLGWKHLGKVDLNELWAYFLNIFEKYFRQEHIPTQNYFIKGIFQTSKKSKQLFSLFWMAKALKFWIFVLQNF